MGNELNRGLSRRDFLKVAGATAGVVALASAGLTAKPTAAFAATGDVVADTYVSTSGATANVYVTAIDNIIMHVDAYLTDPTVPNPPFQLPNHPQSNNAKFIVDETGAYVVVDLVNEYFGLLTIDSNSTNGAAHVASYETVDWNAQPKRISQLKIKLDTEQNTYAFHATEYANVNFMGVGGPKSFDVTLKVDWSSLKTK